MRPVLGIDPGKSGGLCSIDGSCYNFTEMPATLQGLWDWLYNNTDSGVGYVAVLEQVSGFQGAEHPGSRMFAFGENYGAVKMALVSHRIPVVELVRPQKWQGFFSIPPRAKDPKTGKKETDTAFKNRILAVARHHHKGLHITKNVADAVMIAKYAQLVYGELTDAEADGYKVDL